MESVVTEPIETLVGSGARVLVVDDSNTIRRSAEIFLRQGGHEVVLAEDGFDALAKVNDHDPELIFCDILMPRLDGYQTCAIIKRNQRFAHVPVIMPRRCGESCCCRRRPAPAPRIRPGSLSAR